LVRWHGYGIRMLDPKPIPPEKPSLDLNRRTPALTAGAASPTDLSERLRAAVQSLPEVDLFSPNWPKYRYVAASTRHIIFAFAIGANTLAFRLDLRLHPRALASGATAYDECGEDWISFSGCPENGPGTDVESWASQAYDYARAIGE